MKSFVVYCICRINTKGCCKMKKLLKTLLMLCIICSLAVSGTVFVSADDTVAEANATPRTMYYHSGGLDFADGDGYVTVIVTTSAFTYIDEIYHEVTIYRNGSLFSSRTYSDTDCQTLRTNIKVPTSSGDVLTVYVNHYTSHNGIVESGYHETSYIY